MINLSFSKYFIIAISAMAEDSLNVAKMNVNPGGKQPLMRPGWYKRGPIRTKQYMVFQGGPNAGLAKGLRAVCSERIGEDKVIGKADMKKSAKVKAVLAEIFSNCTNYLPTLLL